MISPLSEVMLERVRQDNLYGTQNHDNGRWALILGEEMGEAFQAALGQKETDAKDLRKELIEVAAVAVAWVECIDRNR